jgi:hypothetical protein
LLGYQQRIKKKTFTAIERKKARRRRKDRLNTAQHITTTGLLRYTGCTASEIVYPLSDDMLPEDQNKFATETSKERFGCPVAGKLPHSRSSYIYTRLS